jgi:hypothetical protein
LARFVGAVRAIARDSIAFGCCAYTRGRGRAYYATSYKTNFSWSTVIWIGIIALGIYMPYATDGCQHSPELPYVRKGSREAPLPLHSSEIPKLTGGANFYQGTFSADLYNGTEWTITRVDVAITKKKEQTSESRRFRLSPPETSSEFDPATTKIVEKKIEPVPARPYSKGVFQAEIDDFLNGAQKGEWSWSIVEVFGFRE